MNWPAIVIVFILLICLYWLIYCQILASRPPNKENFAPGGGAAPPTDLPAIQNSLKERASMPLNQYVIKAAYNAAYDGKKITLHQLKQVMSRGCRLLDFEVFINAAGVPYLGISTDPAFQAVRGSGDPPIDLTKALSFVIGQCFSGNVPNPRDPMFIHLRIKTKSTGHYTTVGTAIKDSVYSMLYKNGRGSAEKVFPDKTLLSDIAGKIVVVVDQSINPTEAVAAACPAGSPSSCVSLDSMTNAYTGGKSWAILTYSPPDAATLGDRTQGGLHSPVLDETTGNMGVVLGGDRQVGPPMTAVLPASEGAANPSQEGLFTYIGDLGCQTLLYSFWKQDRGLLAYETLFGAFHTAFIPMGYALSHIKNGDGDDDDDGFTPLRTIMG